MKTHIAAMVRIALALLAYANVVCGSNDVKCAVDGSHLTLTGANMSNLEFKIPSNCSGYAEVKISKNGIGHVNNDSFDIITKPGTILTFDHNTGMTKKSKIEFNADFTRTGITEYRISYNRIELGEGLIFHDNTTKIYMNDNNLIYLPSGLFKNLKKLKTLNLDNNLLTCLDSGMFYGLENLEYLYIKGNSLKNLMPGTFQQLLKLKKIDLSLNKDSLVIRANLFSIRNDSNGQILPDIYLLHTLVTEAPPCLDALDEFHSHRKKLTWTKQGPAAAGNFVCHEDAPDDPETCETFKLTTVQEPETSETFKLTTVQEPETSANREANREKTRGSKPPVKPTVPGNEEGEIYLFFFWGVFVVTALIFLLIAILVSKRIELRNLKSQRRRINSMNSIEVSDIEDEEVSFGDVGAEANVRQVKKQSGTGQNQMRRGSRRKSVQRHQVARRKSTKDFKEKKGTNLHPIAPASRRISKRKSTQIRRATLLGKKTSNDQK